MVHLRKRLSEEELSRINELVAKPGKAMAMEALVSRQDDDDTDDPDVGTGSQLSPDDFVKPADPRSPVETSSRASSPLIAHFRAAISSAPRRFASAIRHHR